MSYSLAFPKLKTVKFNIQTAYRLKVIKTSKHFLRVLLQIGWNFQVMTPMGDLELEWQPLKALM